MTTRSQIVLGGQRFNVSRDAKGVCYVGDETSDAFVERMSLLGRRDIISDLAAFGAAKLQRSLLSEKPKMTAWALHQKSKR